MTFYLRLILTVALWLSILGVFAPALVSAKDTLLVLAGIASVLALPTITYFLWRKK